MSRVTLITGGTGTLGRELVRRLAADRDAPRVVVLSRAVSPASGVGSTEGGGSAVAPPNVEIVQGDIRAGPGLGLAPQICEALEGEVAEIVHCAAATRFNLPLEEARATNVAGTEAVLAFASRCRSLRQVAVFSTVYVAGRRTGTFTEADPCDGGAGFVNTYERTKCEMEEVVRGRMDELPIVLYRLSTIAGDSRTGAVTGFNAFHLALRLLYQGLAPMMPGDGRTRLDLVPLEYVTDAVHWLFRRRFTPGRTYHLCSGPERSPELEELIDASIEAFERFRPEWRRRRIEKPAIVDLATYELFVRSVEETGNDVLREAARAIQGLAYQLAYPKQFDASQAAADLAGSGIEPLPVLAYLPKVVRYCLETHWGAEAEAPCH